MKIPMSKTKEVIITDNESIELLKSNNIVCYEIPNEIINNEQKQIYLNFMLNEFKRKNKPLIFASIVPENIIQFNNLGFKTLFVNTRSNDNVDINYTYEKRLLKKQKESQK